MNKFNHPRRILASEYHEDCSTFLHSSTKDREGEGKRFSAAYISLATFFIAFLYGKQIPLCSGLWVPQLKRVVLMSHHIDYFATPANQLNKGTYILKLF